MKNDKSPVLVSMLAAVITLLPVQVTLCQAAAVETSIPVELHPENKKVAVETSEKATPSVKTGNAEESSMSTGMMIGIGAGAVVLLGAAIAVGSGGGGGDDPAAPIVPPTANNLVDAWHAEGEQPGSGRTYSGTYHLYDGGSLGYDLTVSSGEHLVGGGSWRINGYQLQIHTDHGSRYSGEFTPGNYTVIHMSANTQWNSTLTR